MGSFRTFLRKLWASVTTQPPDAHAERTANDFRDELEHEFQKAKGEWSEIDRSLVRWGTATAGGAIAAGHLRLELPMLGFCILAVGELLSARMQRRKYLKTVPLSVFLELERKYK
jgi:hypothetical protein